MIETRLGDSFSTIFNENESFPCSGSVSSHFFFLPEEIQLILIRKICSDSSSFDQTIRSMALVAKRLTPVVEVVLKEQISELNQSILSVKEKIKEITNLFDGKALVYKKAMQQINIIPVTQEEQQLFSENHQFQQENKYLKKSLLEIDNITKQFDGDIANIKLPSVTLLSYKTFCITSNHLTSLEKTFQKIETLCKESKFINLEKLY